MDTIKSESEDLVNWFYGPPWKRAKRPLLPKKSDAEAITADKNSSAYSNRSGQNVVYSLHEESLGCFNIFKRQREALQKKAEEGMKARVFSFEHPSCRSGGRLFLVSTLERFWLWYSKRDGLAFYELIPDNTPVRLFFDLEYYREPNPDANEEKLVAEFNSCVKETLKQMFDIDIDVGKHMLVLEASTALKFSEHIIVHLPNSHLFPSCSSIKSYINLLEKEMNCSNRGLVFNADGTKKVTLCDTGVYTMNRNFRIFLSSKLNKNNPLKLSPRCKYYETRKEKATPEKIFIDSLVVPPSQSDIKSIFKEISCEQRTRIKERIVNDSYVEILSGYSETSPFPVLEDHILQINRKWRPNVSVRTWKLTKNSKSGHRCITYYLSGCRFCFNIEREHRSNGVYWVVDLDGCVCYQKCFDVDCKGTSSNHFPLPRFVIASIPTSAGLLYEVDESVVGDAAELNKENTDLIVSVVGKCRMQENVEELSEELSRIRRRSALLEKTGVQKAFDSFCDISDDAKLLDIVEAFESNEEISK
ncbi:unnamed protein product [Enterobius vermicularis]|uniref:DNA-directed primase/polymerase protein n=1 Tax=Enterobius vermicularis TaxID=51028 RepID=A0A0N4UXG9_ENTVE|nr:unnamed protein product [Enterobius vermicularis]